MQTRLAVSHEIPDFPFINRVRDKEVINNFVNDTNGAAKVLCLVADGGVGKSRLLWQSFHEFKTNNLVFLLNFPEQRSAKTALLSQMFSQVTNVLNSERDHAANGILVPYRKLENSVSNVVIAGAHLFGLGGVAKEIFSAAENYNRSPFETVDYKKKNHSITVLANSIKKISKNANLLILLDDLHFIEHDDMEEFVYFMSLLELNTTNNVKLVLSTRPSSITHGVISNTIRELSQAGMLAIYEMQELSEIDLSKIAAATIENSSSAKHIIKRAHGNPQLLLNEIIDMNLRGLVSRKNGLLTLPEDQTSTSGVNDDASTLTPLFKDEKNAKILSIMAFLFIILEEQHIEHIYSQVGCKSEAELFEIIESLCNSKVIAGTESKSGLSFRFSHDLLREKVLSFIMTSNPITKRKHIQFVKKSGYEILDSTNRNLLPKIEGLADLSKPIFPVDIEQIALLIKTINLPETRQKAKIDEVYLLIGLTRLCSELNLYSFISMFTQKLSEMLNGNLHNIDERLTRFALERLVHANYQIGNYQSAIQIIKNEEPKSALCVYQVAMSKLILKQTGFTITGILTLLESVTDRKDENIPLLKSLHAVALSETGFVEEALAIHEQNMLEYETINSHSFAWNLFGLMSSVFWQDKDTTLICKDSYNYFLQINHDRYQGMALHNLGSCYLNEGRWNEACEVYKKSANILEKSYPHEVIFPENNLACMEIIEGEFGSAIERLYKCIFRTKSEDYLATLRINLALALFGDGSPEARNIINLASSKKEVRAHTYKHAISTYVEALIELSTSKIDQKLIDLWSKKFKDLRYSDYVADFWNALLIEINKKSKNNLNFEKLPCNQVLRIRDSHFFSPSMSLFRPCTLVFGHI